MSQQITMSEIPTTINAVADYFIERFQEHSNANLDRFDLTVKTAELTIPEYAETKRVYTVMPNHCPDFAYAMPFVFDGDIVEYAPDYYLFLDEIDEDLANEVAEAAGCETYTIPAKTKLDITKFDILAYLDRCSFSRMLGIFEEALDMRGYSEDDIQRLKIFEKFIQQSLRGLKA